MSACPRTDGSRLNRSCQSRWPISTTASPPGRSSVAEKLRPRSGSSPSVGNIAADACRATSCSGSARPVSVKAFPADSARSLNTCCRCCTRESEDTRSRRA